jgi:O-antigen/teichoic acid export membrane protein
MSTRSRLLLLTKFSVAVFDQGMLSAANFVIGFTLIRFTTDSDYGLFVLSQSVVTLLVAAHYSWLSAPLSVTAAPKPPELRRRMIGAIESSQGWLLRYVALVALLAVGLGFALGKLSWLIALVCAGTVLSGWAAMRRDYFRTMLLMYSRPNEVLRADTIYVLVLVLGVFIAAIESKHAILLAISAVILATWLGSFRARATLAKDPGWISGESGPFWQEIRNLGTWSLVGAVIYWIFSQSYNYVLAARIDLKSVADVNAARLMLMPVIVLTVGIGGLLPPNAATWLADLGFKRMIRRLLAFIAIVGLIDLVYVGVVWIGRNWVTDVLMHKHILDRDRLLILWAGVALIGLVRDVLQPALFALRRVRSMAWMVALGAVVSLSFMWWGLTRYGAAAALMGQILGELLNLAGIIALLVRHSRRMRSG